MAASRWTFLAALSSTVTSEGCGVTRLDINDRDMSRVDPGLLVSEGSKLSALDISGNNLSGVDPIKNAKGVISRMDSCQGLFDEDGNLNDEDRFDLTIEEVVWTGMLYCTVSKNCNQEY